MTARRPPQVFTRSQVELLAIRGLEAEVDDARERLVAARRRVPRLRRDRTPAHRDDLNRFETVLAGARARLDGYLAQLGGDR